MNKKKIILKTNNITKRFGGTTALKDVSLEIFEAECHAIVGENGAGKTTLLNILSGAIYPDFGTFEFRGKRYDRVDPKESISIGLNVIHQEFELIEPLSVMENIFISNLGRNLFGITKSKRELRRESKRIIDSLGCDIDPDELVENLSTSKKQIVEISKALASNPKLLIMDEPTAALTQSETEKLFEIIRFLKSKGISIIFVSHRLDEVISISDRVSVLRDGNYIGTVITKNILVDEIIKMMVGRKIELYQKLTKKEKENSVVLQVDGLTKNPFFRDISFCAKKGEILTFSGLVGSGRTELAQSIFGFMKPESGQIKLNGKVCKINSPKDAMKLGIGLLPEDRKINGIINSMVVRENVSIATLPKLSKIGFVQCLREKKLVNEFVKVLNIKISSLEEAVTNLSGGNQQKVVIARWLATQVKILIIDEPTQGIDVGSKAEIHKLLIELTQEGVTIIIISSDLPEVLSISDRILIMRSGQIVGELESSEATEEKIITMATVSSVC